MSYLEYFMNNVVSRNDGQDSQQRLRNLHQLDEPDDERIQGTCYAMCPVEECHLRIKEKMIHVLEKCGTERKLVKSFTRSAADCDLAVPQNLRPYNVLHVTVGYLLFEVTQRRDVSAPTLYEFIHDRLKAVRQDMTIQRLSLQQCAQLLEPMVRFYVYFGYKCVLRSDMTIQRLSLQQCAQLLEPMVRFYVYFGYKLHGLPLKDFDPVLHSTHLLECLKWFLNCCDNAIDIKCTDDEKPTDSELADLMGSMNIEHGGHKLACDQALMETLYILCNLGSNYPLRRYNYLPPELKRDPRMKLAVSIAVANRKGNFVLMTRSMRKLCPLGHCAFCQYLPVLQSRSIKVMTTAFSSKQVGVPGSVVRLWLAFADDEEALSACRHYGLRVTDDGQVMFEKSALKNDAPLHKPDIHLPHKNRLDMPHIFTYTK